MGQGGHLPDPLTAAVFWEPLTKRKKGAHCAPLKCGFSGQLFYGFQVALMSFGHRHLRQLFQQFQGLK